MKRLIRTLCPAVALGLLLLSVSTVLLADEMTFFLAGNGGNCNGCEWIAAQGEITENTPDRFRRYLDNHGEAHLIILHSEGGNLLAAMELGRLIRATGAATSVGQTLSFDDDFSDYNETVPGVCASACVFALMGGVERWVEDESMVGVHQFYSASGEDIDSETVQKVAGISLLYTLRMGIDPSVIVAAGVTSPDGIYWFSTEEIHEFGLDNSSHFIDPWRLKPYAAGLAITTTYHENVRRSVDVTLFCHNTNRWHLLISEENDYFANELGKIPFKEIGPTISVGRQTFSISPDDVVYEKNSDNRSQLSVALPHGLHLRFGETMTFDPGLARVFSSYLYASVELPEQAWIMAAQRNCV